MVPRTLEANVTFPSDMARAVISSAEKTKLLPLEGRLAQLHGRGEVRPDSGGSSTRRGKPTFHRYKGQKKVINNPRTAQSLSARGR
jgi:hypothetical protein